VIAAGNSHNNEQAHHYSNKAMHMPFAQGRVTLSPGKPLQQLRGALRMSRLRVDAFARGSSILTWLRFWLGQRTICHDFYARNKQHAHKAQRCCNSLARLVLQTHVTCTRNIMRVHYHPSNAGKKANQQAQKPRTMYENPGDRQLLLAFIQQEANASARAAAVAAANLHKGCVHTSRV
jgi:hypothetical protein